MSKFYEDLKESFQDIIAYRKGKITLRSEHIEILEPPEEYTPQEIKGIYRPQVYRGICKTRKGA